MNPFLSKCNTKLLLSANFSMHIEDKNNIGVILGRQFAMALLSPLKIILHPETSEPLIDALKNAFFCYR